MRAGAVIATIVVLAGVGAAGAYVMARPQPFADSELSGFDGGNAEAGERIFNAAGCTPCHSRPGADSEARLELAGGLKLETDFGTFVAPNISMDEADGIGSWSAGDFANAMMRGVSPEGSHYYPAFPYASYARMRVQDVADLYAYMRTLPAVAGDAGEHDLAFPYSVRPGVGLWKLLHLPRDPQPVVALAADASESTRQGQYLVEGPGHCGECHTPRDFSGGMELDRWLAGAPAAEGEGRVPNITPGEGGVGSWSETDLAYYFESGFTPDFDSAGGSMAAVQRNLARLPAADREAIAAYLKAIPAQDRQ